MLCSVQSTCGGCPLLSLPRQEELEQKKQRVTAAFQKYGIHYIAPTPIHTSNRLYYRNRIRMQVVGSQAQFFNSVKNSGCPALQTSLWQAITHIRQIMSENPQIFSDTTHLEIRVGDAPEEVGVLFAGAVDERVNKLLPLWKIADKNSITHPSLRYSLRPDLSIDVPIHTFVQINSEVNRLLIDFICKYVVAAGHETFIDFFAGAGNLTLPLLHAGLSGTAIERTQNALFALQKDAHTNRISLEHSDVHTLLDRLSPADLVLCNPPRSGIKNNHRIFAALTKKTMIYVSCDPTSLASDIATLDTYGLQLESAETFDMFPGTRHIETLAILSRK